MNRFRTFHRRWRLEVAIVLVPLLVLVTLQYLSSRRLARVELIAHQTTLVRYMDAVAAAVRSVYETAAHEVLDVPGDALAAERFDAIARHFDQADTSAASLLFVGLLDGCVCLTRYYDPETGHMGIGASHATELVALRVSTLLRLQQMQRTARQRDTRTASPSTSPRGAASAASTSGSATSTTGSSRGCGPPSPAPVRFLRR